MTKADNIKNIKESLKNKTAVVGTERCIKMLKSGNIKEVFLTSNVPDSVRGNVMQLIGISGIPVIEVEMPNDELGMICKKPYPISVFAIKKV
jgi:ribosomal protein L30E